MRRLLPFDFAAISVSVTASFFIRLGWSQRFIDFLPGAILMLAASLLIKPMLMKFFSLYSFHHAASSKYSLSLLNWAQTFSILKATIASSAIIFFLFSPMRYFANFPGLPPTVVIIDCLLFFVMTFVTRWVLVKFGDKTQEFPSIPSNLSTKQFLLGFVALCFLGVVISWKVLAYPFYYDDLHLMRKFTFGEIQSSFSGPWDSDGLEAIGYRPLTKLYNHLRYEFFGENTFAHRVFLISAYSAHLTLLSLVVTKFGVPYRSALVGASLSMVARYNAPHYLWISVGVHTLQLLLFSAALACLIKAIDDRDYIFCSFAILFSVGSLYIREDSISGIIIMLILGYLYIFKNKLSRVFYRQMTYYTVMTLVLSFGYFGLRSIFVPNAGRLQFSFIAIINTLQKISFGYTGMTSFNAISSALLKGWLFFLVLVAGMFIYLLYFYRRSDLSIWLVCAGVSGVLVGISGIGRINLLIFPITFFSIFIAVVVVEFGSRFRAGEFLSALLLISVIGTGLYFRSYAIESMNPLGTTWLRASAKFIYGPYASKATIPPTRERKVISILRKNGIYSWNDATMDFYPAEIKDHLSVLAQEALLDGRRRPDGSGKVFLPYIEILEP